MDYRPPMSGIAARERTLLLDRAEALGPDAPTLCEGWTVHDLLAHLYVREHEPLAASGLVVARLHGFTQRRERAARDRWPFEELLSRLRGGRPLPLRVEAVNDAMNLVENFVHHEDIRRANGDGPRQPPPEDLADALWGNVRRSAALLYRRVRGMQVELRRPDGATANARPFAKGPKVVVSGEVPELVLYSFGRKGACLVRLEGPDDAVAKLAATPLG